MRISAAAKRLGTSPRMLRYREDLGLLPEVRDRNPYPVQARLVRGGGGPAAAGGPATAHGPATVHGPAHRQFSDDDIAAVAAGLELERRYDISPAALAFGLRVIAEPSVRAAVADLGRRLGRVPPAPARALDFEKERALRSLQRP